MTPQMIAPLAVAAAKGRGESTTGKQIIRVDDLAGAINTAYRNSQANAKKAIFYAIQTGELLLSAKSKIPHGEWLAWVDQNCDFDQRTARGYMQLAELPAEKRRLVADMGLRRALKEIADPAKTKPAAPRAKAQREQFAQWLAENDGAVITTPCGTRLAEVKAGRMVWDTPAEVDAGEHHHQPAGGADVEHYPVAAGEHRQRIADIKVMPRGYWRDHPGAQPQFLACLLDAWDESSDETRREFFLILHGRGEFMPIVDSAVAA